MGGSVHLHAQPQRGRLHHAKQTARQHHRNWFDGGLAQKYAGSTGGGKRQRRFSGKPDDDDELVFEHEVIERERPDELEADERKNSNSDNFDPEEYGSALKAAMEATHGAGWNGIAQRSIPLDSHTTQKTRTRPCRASAGVSTSDPSESASGERGGEQLTFAFTEAEQDEILAREKQVQASASEEDNELMLSRQTTREYEPDEQRQVFETHYKKKLLQRARAEARANAGTAEGSHSHSQHSGAKTKSLPVVGGAESETESTAKNGFADHVQLTDFADLLGLKMPAGGDDGDLDTPKTRDEGADHPPPQEQKLDPLSALQLLPVPNIEQHDRSYAAEQTQLENETVSVLGMGND